MASAGSWGARDVAVGSIGRWCAGQVDVAESRARSAEGWSVSRWGKVIVWRSAGSRAVSGVREVPGVNLRGVKDVALRCETGMRGVNAKGSSGDAYPVSWEPMAAGWVIVQVGVFRDGVVGLVWKTITCDRLLVDMPAQGQLLIAIIQIGCNV